MQRRHWFLSAAFVSLTLGSLAACNADDDGTPGNDADAGDATADHTAPDTGAPSKPDAGADVNVPDTNVPDTNVNTPDTNVPDTNVADTNVADTNVADTNVPDTNVPDTNVADTNVADTNVPDTNIPDTNVPDTHVPDANVPDTSTTDAGADANETGPSNACLTGDAGYLIVPEDWSFAVSAPALNGGKGQVITINRCDSVLWTNTDTSTHSVVSTSPAFSFSTAQHGAGPYAPIQFPIAGKFTYECGVHGSGMIGEITVK